VILTDNLRKRNNRFPVLQVGPQPIGVDNTAEEYKDSREKINRTSGEEVDGNHQIATGLQDEEEEE
jgi:hypothetical protein